MLLPQEAPVSVLVTAAYVMKVVETGVDMTWLKAGLAVDGNAHVRSCTCTLNTFFKMDLSQQ